MTATQQALMNVPTGFQRFTFGLLDAKSGAPAAVFIFLSSNGQIGIGGSGSSVVPLNWFEPVTAGIGASYWAKLVVKSGTPPTSGTAVGTPVSCTGTPQWNWTQGAVGAITASVAISIYTDAAGTQLVYTTPDSAVSVNRT